MKRNKCLLLLTIACINVSAFAAPPQFSGVFNSTLNLGAGRDALPEFYYGLEEYANIRLKWSANDYGSLYASFNFLAAAGTKALGLSQSMFGVSGGSDNYVASMELERLYFHLSNERVALDGGLMRLAFGYGNVFKPMDYFNQANPLYPDARLRAILGADAVVYPSDMSAIHIFAVLPHNSFALTPWNMYTGAAGEVHGNKLSAQAIYFWQPIDGDAVGNHYAGVSLKADLVIGITANVLYSYTNDGTNLIDGLAASAGIDYSFSIYTRTLYIVAEYLYNGKTSATAFSTHNPYGYNGHHHIYGSARFGITDLSSATLGALVALNDGGGNNTKTSLIAIYAADLFQGANLSVQANVPINDNANPTKADFSIKLSFRI